MRKLLFMLASLLTTAVGPMCTQIFAQSAKPNLPSKITANANVNQQDLNALVEAYLSGAQATSATDIDHDGTLSIADITRLVAMMNIDNSDFVFNSNGHSYVDLGLPSGTLWATCNVDASSPLEPGGFYAWGETETKEIYSYETYKWCDGTKPTSTNPSLTKYSDQYSYGRFDGKITLELEDDVAHVKWGGDWHMPSTEQFQELIEYCQVEYFKIDTDFHCLKFTGTNGNSVIFTAAGYRKDDRLITDYLNYWSAQLTVSSNPKNTHGINSDVLRHSGSDPKPATIGGTARYQGLTVRPVLSPYEPIVHLIETPTSYLNHDLVDLGLPSGTLWATCNVGASSPEDYGCYYSWGETYGSCEGKTVFDENNYMYYNGDEVTKYTSNGSILDSSDDVATTEWEGAWRMPTRTEMQELYKEDYTIQEWTEMNGVYGIRITSLVPGYEDKSIFFPAAGYYRRDNYRDVGEQGIYWCSSLRVSELQDSMTADCIRLGDNYFSGGATYRCFGLSVRPVVSSSALAK